MEDPLRLGLLDAWLEDLERNYRALVDGMAPAWCEHGELDVQAAADARDQIDETLRLRIGFCSPARMTVQRRDRGELRDEEAVATQLLLVDKGVSPQPDGIAVTSVGERWHIRGHRLADGTTCPAPVLTASAALDAG